MWCHHLSHINENGLKYLSCSESCLYQMQISLLVFIATCTMCMSSLTEDSSWCLVLCCLFLWLSCFSVKMYFLSSISCESPTNISWIDVHVTCFVFTFQNKNKECVYLLTFRWSHAITMCIVSPCLCVFPWSWSCTKMQKWNIVPLLNSTSTQ